MKRLQKTLLDLLGSMGRMKVKGLPRALVITISINQGFPYEADSGHERHAGDGLDQHIQGWQVHVVFCPPLPAPGCQV